MCGRGTQKDAVVARYYLLITDLSQSFHVLSISGSLETVSQIIHLRKRHSGKRKQEKRSYISPLPPAVASKMGTNVRPKLAWLLGRGPGNPHFRARGG